MNYTAANKVKITYLKLLLLILLKFIKKHLDSNDKNRKIAIFVQKS